MIFSIKKACTFHPLPQLTHLQSQNGAAQLRGLSERVLESPLSHQDGTSLLGAVLAGARGQAGGRGEQKRMGCREEMRPTLEFNRQFGVALRFLAAGSSRLWVFSLSFVPQNIEKKTPSKVPVTVGAAASLIKRQQTPMR